MATLLRNMQEAQARQSEAQARYRARLLAEYGPDRWSRGDVVLFRPHPEESDQETRAAVKIGDDEWTLTARGGTRSWAETLIKAGPGHVLVAVTGEKMARVVQGISTT